jgi:hypothetical protein
MDPGRPPTPPPLPERPRLRAVEAFPAELRPGERVIVMRDPRGVSDKVIGLPPPVFALAVHFDGSRTIRDVQAAWARRTGELLRSDQIEAILRALDECLFLEGERFDAARRRIADEFRAAEARPAAHAGGAYPGERAALVEYIDALYVREGGPGRVPGRAPAPEGAAAAGERKLVGIIAPHIDPNRGNVAYAHAFDALARAGGADLYVIFGTAHQGGEDTYIFTRKHFDTPLGRVETDRAFIDRLERRLGGAALDRAELSHRTEHSVEFQTVFLRHVEERIGRRPAEGEGAPRIVPLICGSYHAYVESGRAPSSDAEHARLFAALRAEIEEEEARGRRVVLIAGADLAHIGPKFGDERPADEGVRRACEEQDRASLERALAVDGEGFFAAIADEKDSRNICGLSCIYAMLRTMEAGGGGARARAGRLLAYGMAPDPVPGSFVSYCAAAFHA